MKQNELQDLIKLIDSSTITEFKLKEGDFELMIRTKEYFKQGKRVMAAAPENTFVQSHAQIPADATAAAQAQTPMAEAQEKSAEARSGSKVVDLKSPIVGTFYRASGPEKGPFVKVGDHIDVGTVVCIVEAMKLFNEIESEVSGKIVEILVEDANPVEYDQVLFRVETN